MARKAEAVEAAAGEMAVAVAVAEAAVVEGEGEGEEVAVVDRNSVGLIQFLVGAKWKSNTHPRWRRTTSR